MDLGKSWLDQPPPTHDCLFSVVIFLATHQPIPNLVVKWEDTSVDAREYLFRKEYKVQSRLSISQKSSTSFPIKAGVFFLQGISFPPRLEFLVQIEGIGFLTATKNSRTLLEQSSNHRINEFNKDSTKAQLRPKESLFREIDGWNLPCLKLGNRTYFGGVCFTSSETKMHELDFNPICEWRGVDYVE